MSNTIHFAANETNTPSCSTRHPSATKHWAKTDVYAEVTCQRCRPSARTVKAVKRAAPAPVDMVKVEADRAAAAAVEAQIQTLEAEHATLVAAGADENEITAVAKKIVALL